MREISRERTVLRGASPALLRLFSRSGEAARMRIGKISVDGTSKVYLRGISAH